MKALKGGPAIGELAQQYAVIVPARLAVGHAEDGKNLGDHCWSTICAGASEVAQTLTAQVRGGLPACSLSA
jgi:hypothetical protein